MEENKGEEEDAVEIESETKVADNINESYEEEEEKEDGEEEVKEEKEQEIGAGEDNLLATAF